VLIRNVGCSTGDDAIFGEATTILTQPPIETLANRRANTIINILASMKADI